MNRPIRIGLIAEGKTELGNSVPFIAQDGGKPIQRDAEGALHTLIRRELQQLGVPDCVFVYRHLKTTEKLSGQVRTGHSILERKYLAQVVIAWKPEEVDLILIVVDADSKEAQRKRDLERALATIRENHLDGNEQPIADRSASGLAIRNFEAWLLADTHTISKVLGIELEAIDDLEALEDTKDRLEQAIATSTYLSEDCSNQRPLQVRWDLAHQIELAVIKARCPIGYGGFVNNLGAAAKATVKAIATSCHHL